MESDERYYRRRFAEELAAAKRAMTPAGAERRILLARSFAQRLGLPDSAACLATSRSRKWLLELD